MKNHKLTGFLNSLLFTLIFSAAAFGQAVDHTYNPSAQVIPTNPTGNGVKLVAVENNKTLVRLTNVDPNTVYKLNADGSIDTSFDCRYCNIRVTHVAVQPDGKYILSGLGATDNVDPDIIRVNTDGSIDGSFTTPFGLNNYRTEVYAVTPDNKSYVLNVGQNALAFFYRLNSNGSIDNTFTAIPYGNVDILIGNGSAIGKVALYPDGRLLIGGRAPSGSGRPIYRVNPDGSQDLSFSVPVIARSGSGGSNYVNVYGLVIQPSGSIVASGIFDTVNALTRRRLVRLNADGSVDDRNLDMPSLENRPTLTLRSDGQMIFEDGTNFYLINADVTTKTIISPGSVYYAVDSLDRIVFVDGNTIRRINGDGTPDPSFVFDIKTPGTARSVLVQSDGKAIVAGNFEFLNGEAAPRFGRLNVNGTRDASFNPGTGFTFVTQNSTTKVFPTRIALTPDGKILAHGGFNTYNGTSVPNAFIRINSDGSLDPTFDPGPTSSINFITVQPDGKVLLFGGNISINGFARPGIARLNANGTLDQPFSPQVSGTVMQGLVEPDGKITFVGQFNTVGALSRQNMARINADGTPDATLNPGTPANMDKIARQPDGKYVVAINTTDGIKRRNADGTADNSFVAPPVIGTTISNIRVLQNGKILVSGSWESPRRNFFRLWPNGAVDQPFLRQGFNKVVRDFALDGQNRFVAVGDFTIAGAVGRNGIARVNLQTTAFDFEGDRRADPSVTRTSNFVWHQLLGPSYTYQPTSFGQPGDISVPADYDGDGITDIAVWRPSTGDWFWKRSSDGVTVGRNHGSNGDIPLPSDTDGDGIADLVVVKPNFLWSGVKASTGELIVYHLFGQAGDKPIMGDYDGDGKYDMAVYRPGGDWVYVSSANNYNNVIFHWGTTGDKPAPGDYDGDGRTDFAVYRPSDGVWYIRYSSNGTYLFQRFGLAEDRPIAADYDGDGLADIAVFRPSDGYWYILYSTGGFTGFPWGIASDVPSPGAYLQ